MLRNGPYMMPHVAIGFLRRLLIIHPAEFFHLIRQLERVNGRTFPKSRKLISRGVMIIQMTRNKLNALFHYAFATQHFRPRSDQAKAIAQYLTCNLIPSTLRSFSVPFSDEIHILKCVDYCQRQICGVSYSGLRSLLLV
jgi:hypothetical protein